MVCVSHRDTPSAERCSVRPTTRLSYAAGFKAVVAAVCTSEIVRTAQHLDEGISA